MAVFAQGASEWLQMLADFGVAVVHGTVATEGLLDIGDEVVEEVATFAGRGAQQGGGIIGSEIKLTVRTDDFAAGALNIDQALTVDGVNYAIRDRLGQSQAAAGLNLTKLLLRKA